MDETNGQNNGRNVLDRRNLHGQSKQLCRLRGFYKKHNMLSINPNDFSGNVILMSNWLSFHMPPIDYDEVLIHDRIGMTGRVAIRVWIDTIKN